jgi:hypothetical protein
MCVDPLTIAAQKARENADPARMDLETATAVLQRLLSELPEHFGPDAHAAYVFWLRNRIEALRTERPFHPWVMTTSYIHYPELLMCRQP